jgi:hypothetical protein
MLITPHASRFTFHAPRFMHPAGHVARFVLDQAPCDVLLR